jgi:hypothetical protein
MISKLLQTPIDSIEFTLLNTIMNYDHSTAGQRNNVFGLIWDDDLLFAHIVEED